MFSSVLAGIVVALKALPAIESLVEHFLDAWKAHDEAQARKEAIELKAAKDAAVDAAIDGPSGLPVKQPGSGPAQQ